MEQIYKLLALALLTSVLTMAVISQIWAIDATSTHLSLLLDSFQ